LFCGAGACGICVSAGEFSDPFEGAAFWAKLVLTRSPATRNTKQFRAITVRQVETDISSSPVSDTNIRILSSFRLSQNTQESTRKFQQVLVEEGPRLAEPRRRNSSRPLQWTKRVAAGQLDRTEKFITQKCSTHGQAFTFVVLKQCTLLPPL
jgi:hypothetical protein